MLDSRGRVVDALPGLYGPRAFLEQLIRAANIAHQVAHLPADETRAALRDYHNTRLQELAMQWTSDTARAGVTLTAKAATQASAPLSHYWYVATPLAKTKKFEDPLAKATQSGRAMIVEFRSTGTQTIVPPSRHPSGEYYEWHEDSAPAQLSSDLLLPRIALVAACSLVARYWPDGHQHDAALTLAGGLLRAGWTVANAEHFIVTPATVAGDNEVEDRRLAVSYTVERLKQHEEATGWPRLSELIPEQIVKCLTKWLGIQSVSAKSGRANENAVVINDWSNPEPLPNSLLPVPALHPELLPEPFAP